MNDDENDTPAGPTQHTWVDRKDAEKFGEAKCAVAPMKVVERPRKTKKRRPT